MNINEILQELDQLFITNRIEEVEVFLKEQLQQARQEENVSVQVTILNELMGYYRDLTRYEDSINICEEAMNLLHKEGLQGTVPYATTLQNVANALRAAGQLEASLSYYNKVFSMYENQLEKTDIRYASLYNNMSLLFQNMEEYEKSCDYLKKALEIVSINPNAIIEVATTHTNIGASLLQLGETEEAREHLIKAFEIFNRDINKDHHYSAACAAMGDLVLHEGNYEEAAFYYGTAMEELLKHVGATDNYELMKKKYGGAARIFYICRDNSLFEDEPALEAYIDSINTDTFDSTEFGFENGMDLCRQFYKQHGEPAFKKHCKVSFEVLTFGLIGYGSECHGFDDEHSRDHDWGPGFCVWYRDDCMGYDEEQIGYHQLFVKKLNRIYNDLPRIYKGIIRHETPQGKGRTGVMGIEEFYYKIFQVKPSWDKSIDLEEMSEDKLFTVCNGEIFKKGSNPFQMVRNQCLDYHSDSLYIEKLAQAVHEVSQSGQYNYLRMLKRGDKLTASLYFYKFIESTMDLCYLINSQYAPYTKWKLKGMEGFTTVMDMKSYLEILVEQGPFSPKAVEIIEVICAYILEELVAQGFTKEGSDFLDDHVAGILEYEFPKESKEETRDYHKISNEISRDESTANESDIDSKADIDNKVVEIVLSHISPSKQALVDAVVLMEWKAFDRVDHIEGCRADCQDNWETFRIMRSSQFLAWTDELLYSYQKDFLDANLAGWNMITEKYGQMMISTDPKEYAELSKHFPTLSEERLNIIEQIVAIQVKWMEEFSAEYPNISTGARSIHTSEDSTFNTSYETYLRGELKTYSDRTFKLYGQFIVDKYKKGHNLAFDIISNTAALYGCNTVKELDELMSKK